MIYPKYDYVLRHKESGRFVGLNDDFSPAYAYNHATEEKRDNARVFRGVELYYSDNWQTSLIPLVSLD